MINQLKYIYSKQTYPYKNLALEEYLLQNVEKGECILYLWQNQKTVVIGRNQNCFKECKVRELEQDGGYLVRRLSGGGAVFHDLGNLNFTFLVRQEDYNLERQLDVILKAVQKLGIKAEKSGRNDITVDGQKFSGNAFYSSNGHCYHHGTLLINVDMDSLSRYLNVSADKLQSKGVTSVKSRVANLTQFKSNVTISLMCEKLIEAFGEVYGLIPKEILDENIDDIKLVTLINKFSSWEWKFGRSIKFTYELCKRFNWGDFQLQLSMNNGKVIDATAFSDAMDFYFISQISNAIIGCIFKIEALVKRINEIPTLNEMQETMSDDIKNLLLEQNI